MECLGDSKKILHYHGSPDTHLSLQDALASSRGPVIDCTRSTADVLPPSDYKGLHIVFGCSCFPSPFKHAKQMAIVMNYMPLLGHLIVNKTARGIVPFIGGMEDAINTVDFHVRYYLLSINRYHFFILPIMYSTYHRDKDSVHLTSNMSDGPFEELPTIIRRQFTTREILFP